MNKKYLLSLFLFIISISISAKIYYVNASASGENNGLSWDNAFTDLQNALTISIAGDEIWVAKGTYYTTSFNNRDVSFNIKSGVNLYGGFFGNETSTAERDIINNVTVLSGDIGAKNDNSDNTKTVVKFENINNEVVFNAFKIEGGNDMIQDNIQGGTGVSILNSNAKINLFNIIVNNCRGYNKAAVYIVNSKVNADNCLFSLNFSMMLSGAMYASNSSEINLTNSKFEQNSANLGAALDFQGKNLKMDRCTISKNTCFSGNIINVGVAVENFVLSNSLIVGNLAMSANILSSSSQIQNSVKIINSTITDNNSSSSFVSSIYKYPNASPIRIYNCIIYDNANNVEINSQNLVYNSIVKNGYNTGVNIIDANALFKNPGSSSLAPFEASLYNYSLKDNSPAIDAGNNGFITDYNKDLFGNNRIVNNVVDLGAIEFKELLSAADLEHRKDFIYSNSQKSIILLDKNLINKDFVIFDIQGKKIVKEILINPIIKLNLNKGFYIVGIGNRTKKIIVD